MTSVSLNTPAKREAFNAEIRRTRQELGSIPVILHKLPRWFPQAIRAAIRAGRLTTVRGPNGFYAHDMASSVVVPGHGQLKHRVWDHWGQTSDGTVVTEPYHLEEQDLVWLSAFAEAIGATMTISDRSWWFPPYTKRVEFREM